MRKAETLALEVWKLGHAAICPHANTRFFQHECPDQLWLDGDIAILKKCDGILMTPDWKQSSGAMIEHATALDEIIPIFYHIGDLKNYLQGNENESKFI